MTGELRALGVTHGLLLGLVLGSPLVAPALMPWGVEALFVVSAFQVRLADRRGALRSGWRGWISHIRMAPRRFILWAATALVALMTGQHGQAAAIATAALLCELLAYPVCAPLLGRMGRGGLMATLFLLIAAGGVVAGETGRLTVAFMTGMTACMVWLRGPDGDVRALALATGGAGAAALCASAVPSMVAFAGPAAMTCATLALAHLSILRRTLLPWQPDAAPLRGCFAPPAPAGGGTKR